MCPCWVKVGCMVRRGAWQISSWSGVFEVCSPHWVLCCPLDTSRRPKDSEREGQGYSFVSRAEMEADIRAGRYLEHGEYEGNLYGTRIDSIRNVVASGKVCVLDVNPQVSISLPLCSPNPQRPYFPTFALAP